MKFEKGGKEEEGNERKGVKMDAKARRVSRTGKREEEGNVKDDEKERRTKKGNGRKEGKWKRQIRGKRKKR